MSNPNQKPEAVLFGPFVGEFFWEAFRFAPMVPFFKFQKYKNRDIKVIVCTREDRFDLYGKYADILVPLHIKGDGDTFLPDCFRLIDFPMERYDLLVKNFAKRYSEQFTILEHVYPNVRRGHFNNKNQFPRRNMIYEYQPRNENYQLIQEYIPNDKPIVILAPRFRKGIKRNWPYWVEFYNTLANDVKLMDTFRFVICGKPNEYIPDPKERFFDINKIPLGKNSSLAGLLLALLERAVLTFGSQSAIPNLSLLYGVEVLEFGCQKHLHTVTYNPKNTPVHFVVNKNYDITVTEIFGIFRKTLLKKGEKR